MTTRSDVVQDFNFDPRISTVLAPSTAFLAQDIVDTLRKIEDRFEGMTHSKLLDAEGKAQLGGGEQTSITVTLRNNVIEFEARRTPAETGTITTGAAEDARGLIQLIDNTADFITAGVQAGSFIINWTDQSITDVRRVVSATQLECKGLLNGTDNDFDLADAYSVFNIIQCEVLGGNVVGTDEFGADQTAFLPSAFTQIVTARSSSGTLQELEEIRLGSFQGGAWYEAGSGNSGTDYPNGNALTPVDNFPDAVAIANANGLDTIFVKGSATLDTGDDVTSFKIVGQGRQFTTLTLNAGAVLTGAVFRSATVTGTLDGNSVVFGCDVTMPLTFVEGTLEECGLGAGTMTLGGSADTELIGCYSNVAGLGTPIIDFGGNGRDLILRRYSGGIQINNKDGAGDAASIDMVSGQIILDSTVTAGTLRLSGVAKLTDNSVGATVDTTGLINQTTIAEAVWNASITLYQTAGTMGEWVTRKLLSVTKFLGLK